MKRKTKVIICLALVTFSIIGFMFFTGDKSIKEFTTYQKELDEIVLPMTNEILDHVHLALEKKDMTSMTEWYIKGDGMEKNMEYHENLKALEIVTKRKKFEYESTKKLKDNIQQLIDALQLTLNKVDHHVTEPDKMMEAIKLDLDSIEGIAKERNELLESYPE
jgi:nitrogen regulatory protein PII